MRLKSESQRPVVEIGGRLSVTDLTSLDLGQLESRLGDMATAKGGELVVVEDASVARV